jgi:capsular polysaccharide export protein
VKTIVIEGPVLLLMGPIGTFFSRLANHLELRGVPVTKISFPLHEFGFARHQRVPYAGPMDTFQPFLESLILERGIRHLFMYGDFVEPHRLAIDLVRRMNAEKSLAHPIDAWVFELGYIRPNYVSLELERVNARSNLNQSVEFYRALPAVDVIPQARMESGLRWRKWWKMPTFIQHAFTPYPIIQGPHKLQPKPSYLLAQVLGLIRKHIYRYTQRLVRRQLMDGTPFTLVPLQVSSDSQVSLGSNYAGTGAITITGPAFAPWRATMGWRIGCFIFMTAPWERFSNGPRPWSPSTARWGSRRSTTPCPRRCWVARSTTCRV